jgi:hypothetical protein
LSNEDVPYLYSYYLDGQIKWDEMGETRGTHEREEKCLQGFFFGGETRRKETTWKT